MGALVGALYAAAPQSDTEQQFRALVRAYEEETRALAMRNGVALAVLFGGVAAATGLAPPAAAAGGGFAIGVGATARMDHERLVEVMNGRFGGRTVESLPVPLVALYQERRGHGVAVVAPRSGKLADVVGASIANPFLFPELDVRRAGRFDPGGDRAAATPVEDACRLFPDARLLVVNVTGQPALTTPQMKCPRREVQLPPARLSPEEVFSFGPGYVRAVADAQAAVTAVLQAEGDIGTR